MDKKIRVGISACLLGERVRFDGGHKFNHFIAHTLGRFLEYVPVCPEVEMGLPVPREPLRLIGESEAPRLVFSKSGEDITERMLLWAQRKVNELEGEDLCGFIFKGRSPSSGMERVNLYDRNGVPQKRGVGLFAQVFMKHFPNLPVEEEGRLNDPLLRENFIEAIFTLQRWKGMIERSSGLKSLLDFHTRHKLLLLSHSPQLYREAGHLLATSRKTSWEDLGEKYFDILMRAIRILPTRGKHVNVLQHAIGYFKDDFSNKDKEEILQLVNAYREGCLPLIVPVTLLTHYIRKHDHPYLEKQVYFHPYPMELSLRSHT